MVSAIVSFVVSGLLSGWVAYDAERRGRRRYRWGTFVFFTGLVGLGVWLVVRRRSPVNASGRGLWREVIRAAALTVPLTIASLVFMVLLITYIVQRARVDSHAMEPTLQFGRHVWVNKFAYQRGDPRVGDVVMLNYPKNPTLTFALRIVAVGGDRLRIEDGQVFVNDRPLAQEFIPLDYRSHDELDPIVIPQGWYFLMGDRRNIASDSRRWGLVPRKYVLGRIAL